MIKLEIRHWSSHLNMLIYSLLYYCEKNEMVFDLNIKETLPYSSAILYYNNTIVFFDYSDSTIFIENNKKYDFYFKRSLLAKDYCSNIYPLNFQVNLSYKALKLVQKFKINDFIKNKDKKINRIELVRALDYFNVITNLSHNAMDIRYIKNIEDNRGRVVFFTRLWNPNNHNDQDEKERRALQNEFRIKACEIIKLNFKNSYVGVFPDSYSEKMCSENILLKVGETSKINYLKKLSQSNIGIADDGLKDTPGWKIGEYILQGKAVITTPINIEIENFNKNLNYLELSNRLSYDELPDKINHLLENKNYLEMSRENKKWSAIYLHPKNYFNRIVSIIS